LQEKIDTVTVEGDENVGEEDCIKMKTEEDYMELGYTIKTEKEVSVLCWCIFLVVIYLQVCVHECCIVHYI
jgi:hypothetical protein